MMTYWQGVGNLVDMLNRSLKTNKSSKGQCMWAYIPNMMYLWRMWMITYSDFGFALFSFSGGNPRLQSTTSYSKEKTVEERSFIAA